MGLRRKFSCPSCDYEAIVSGGPDMGLRAATRTIHCTTCKELRDAVTNSKALGNFSSRTAADLLRTAVPLRCQEDESHPVEPWIAGGPCPKCGADMGQGQPYTKWD